MLTKLSKLQESEESVWGCPEVSFTIETHAEESDEIVRRLYTFSHAKEWDKWMFNEFEEKRVDASSRVTNRNWRRSRHIMWHDSESPTVKIPAEVEEQLEELLGVEELVLQSPGSIE